MVFAALLESLQQNGHASTHSDCAGDSEGAAESQSSAAEEKRSESAKAYTTEQADAVKR